MDRRHLVTVFARAPERGKVKTRLAADVGPDRALALYAWLGARTVRGLVVPGRRYDVHVTYTPRGAEAALAAWLGPVDGLYPQPDADLGARMRFAVERGLARGYASVLLVGTDCAALTAARVDAALDALADHDAVIGPATDGGYYLLGMTRPLPVFEGVAWSTEAVTPATRALLRGAGARWAELPAETDVDTAADLAALAHLPDAPGWVRGG